MSQKDVLVTDYVDPVLLKGLNSLGYHPVYAPEMSRLEMETYLPHFKGVVINTRCAVTGSAIEKSGNLKWIARLGSGLDIIDLDAAARHGIEVISAPEGNAQAVAEHAMAMLLSLSNKIIQADQQVREGQWLREQNRGWEITGKTIGIIGYGNNGSAFGRLWKGWDVTVLAYDKYLGNYGDENVLATDRDELLKQADIISLHIPLTDETLNMVNEEFINQCKDSCVLINTSRGKIVDIAALINALKNRKLKGACLDVLPSEPPSSGTELFVKNFEELSLMRNVVLTPHVAGWTVESKRRIAEVILKKLVALGKSV